MTWFTVKNEQGQAYAAFSQDAGKTFAAPIRVDDGGSLGRVDIEMLPDGSALATWIEFAPFARATGENRRAVPGTPHRTQRHTLGGRSRSPASPARAPAAIRAPRSRTVKWYSRGPNPPTVAAAFARPGASAETTQNEAVATQGRVLRVPAAGGTGGLDAAAPGTRVSARPEPSGIETRGALFMRSWMTPSTFKG